MPLAATLAAAPATSARASLFSCFEALAPLEQAQKAAEVAATAGSCSAQATGDPVMAMTIAALTAAAVGGAFSTTGQCNAQINGAVGKLVAAALLTLPLPSDAKNLLSAFVNGSTPLTFEEIVSAFPALNAVIAYIHCGCAVAGAPGEYEKIADDYAENVKGCANFASDAVGTVLDGVGSLGEDIHHALNGPSMKPGIQQEQTCWVQELPDGVWTATPIWTKPTFQCNVLRCAPGHVVIKKAEAGKTLNQCAAKCPDPIQSFQSGGKCYSTIDWKPVEGVCTQVPGMVHCCGDGQQVVKWGACSPACSQGIQYWDTQAGACANCKAGWYPVYESSTSSVGSCNECAVGESYDFASKTCEPLDCQGPTAYFDPKRPHKCSNCPPGKVYSGKRNKCECGEGSFAKGGGCVCPQGAIQQSFAATFTCACPPGSTLDPDAFACVCPPGQHIQSKNIQGSVYSQCVADDAPVLAPPTAQPGMICPPGMQLRNGVCAGAASAPRSPSRVVPTPPVVTPPRVVPTPPVVTPPRVAPPPAVTQPRVVPQLASCPAGTLPNATHSDCVPAATPSPR